VNRNDNVDPTTVPDNECFYYEKCGFIGVKNRGPHCECWSSAIGCSMAFGEWSQRFYHKDYKGPVL
jgi:hypothetical protein